MESDGQTKSELWEVLKANNITGSTVNLTQWQWTQLLVPTTLQGIQCLLEGWNTTVFEAGCNSTLEGNICWPNTAPEEISWMYCPKDRSPVYRPCSANGTWMEGNYSSCLRAPAAQSKPSRPMKEISAHILFFGSLLSIACLLAALFIFHRYKSIRCDRITVHIHLMLALALKCGIQMVVASPVLFKSSVYRRWDWVCKATICTQMYTLLASISWMFVQGHYLNSKLTNNVFSRKFPLTLYSIVGWGLPFASTLSWAITMEILHPSKCWKRYGHIPVIWMVVGPMLFVLLVNLIFYINVVRIMMMKINQSQSTTEWQQMRRVFKATAVLFPLLGLTNLLFFYNPGFPYQPYYMVFNAISHSSQGLLVSVFYCFICDDVRGAIRREYNRVMAERNVHDERNQALRRTIKRNASNRSEEV